MFDDWYDFVFLALLSPFIMVLIGGFLALLIWCFSIARLLVQIARGEYD